MTKQLRFFCFIWVGVLLTCSLHAATRGLSVDIRDRSGKQVGMYEKSHALLIGVSDYTAGWPDLQTIPAELVRVESVLKEQGFNVVKVMDPDSTRLQKAFEDFIDQYGYNENDRLLFFYSGHGYSRKNGTKGYLVPTDAPNPEKDRKGFLRKALNMNMIITWSRQIESKHALFLFDSCFSGAIFKTKALPKTPPHINAFTASPVRQYITAGSAGEEVPARSVFTPSFVRALEGEADLNKDGYVTGTEMGMFLNEKVMGYNSQQTPQYGKIKDPDLDRGDFVFVSPATPGSASASSTGTSGSTGTHVASGSMQTEAVGKG
ncbi:caspase family protein, partial [bacterium]|nr:caspase family protein [bacterium]